MKGVILAAGDGGRLRPLTLETPKALLEVGRRPLIHYAVEALQAAEVSEIAVVVGYRGDQIVTVLGEAFPELTFLRNEQYSEGNALSVRVAEPFVGDEPFVLCMGDHAISNRIVSSLLSNHQAGCILCVDPDARHPSQVDDATRVLVSPTGWIEAIGKHLEVWNATDVGVFSMTSGVFEAIDRLMFARGGDVGISDVVTLMGERGNPFGTCDVGGMFWADVDTMEDYHLVDSLVRETNGAGV